MIYYINSGLQLLENIFETYILYRFFNAYFDQKIISRRLQMYLIFVVYVLTSAIMLFCPYTLLNIVSALGCLFLLTCCYRTQMSKRFFIVVITYLCMFFTEAITALMVGVADVGWFNKQYFSVLISLVSDVMMWIIVSLILKFMTRRNMDVKVPKLFLVAVFIVTFTTIFLETLIFQDENRSTFIAVLSLFWVFVTVFIMFYLYDVLVRMLEASQRAEMIEREKVYYIAQSELVQQNYKEMRRFRHDMKNRMMVLEHMMKEGQSDRIMSYIDKVTKKLDRTEEYSQSGNTIIDSIINYKLARSKQLGVQIKSHIAIPSDIPIEEDDIVTILGNILDNANEALEKVEGEKYLDLELLYEKQCVNITLTNTFDSIVEEEDGKIATRKDDKRLHGIGLESVESSIEKYNGIMNVSHNENQFVVFILLYV